MSISILTDPVPRLVPYLVRWPEHPEWSYIEKPNRLYYVLIVDREQLWQGMHEYGFPDKLTRLIKATMDRVMCYVRVSGVLASMLCAF